MSEFKKFGQCYNRSWMCKGSVHEKSKHHSLQVHIILQNTNQPVYDIVEEWISFHKSGRPQSFGHVCLLSRRWGNAFTLPRLGATMSTLSREGSNHRPPKLVRSDHKEISAGGGNKKGPRLPPEQDMGASSWEAKPPSVKGEVKKTVTLGIEVLDTQMTEKREF